METWSTSASNGEQEQVSMRSYVTERVHRNMRNYISKALLPAMSMSGSFLNIPFRVKSSSC